MDNTKDVLFSVNNEEGEKIYPKEYKKVWVNLGPFMLPKPRPRASDRPNPEKEKK